MITDIAIRDFQSLADEVLELGPLTVLVGASNSGKSAVRRAMEGLLRNDAATGRVRVGAKTMGVSVTALDGAKSPFHIHWEKGAGANRYVLEEDACQPLTIDKPGSTIPEAAGNLLAIDPDISITSQFDPPFLLSAGPSAVARTLGDLTNITVLYDGIREASRQKAALSKEAKTYDEMAEAQEAKLAEYAWLVDEGPTLTLAAERLAEATRADQVAYAVAADLSSALRMTDELLAAAETMSSLPDYATATQALAAAEELLSAMNAWEGIRYEAWGLAAVVEAQTLELGLIGDLNVAQQTVEDAHDAVAAFQGLERALGEYRATEAALAHAEAGWAELEASMAVIHAEIDTFDTCPLCGGQMGAPC